MSGNKLFLDTNIAIYLLSGDDTLGSFFDGKTLFVSFITELELLSYHLLNDEDKARIISFLKDCKIVEINDNIKHNTIGLRKEYRLKLPDSIIAASAAYLGVPLITADNQLHTIDKVGLNIIAYKKK